MNEPLGRVDGVTKHFVKGASPALDALTARIDGRQVEPDDAGKITLLPLIAGLLLPNDEELRVCGFNPTTEPPTLHRVIAYIPKRFGLHDDLSVIENLQLYADLRAEIGTKREHTFEHLLALTNLTPLAGRLVGALSGGMKQKLGLACALIKRPQILLLDEPSVGVDPISRRELWRMVYEHVDQGIGVIWSPTYLNEAERCASVLLLSDGKLLYQGPSQELTASIKERTFLVQNMGVDRRSALSRAFEQPAEIDGAIQGRSVRLVVGKGKRAEVQILLDGRRSNTAQILMGYTTHVVGRFNEELAEHGVARSTTIVVVRAWYSKNFETLWSAVPALFAVLLSGYTTPVENMPDWLQWLAETNLITHFIIICQNVFLKDVPAEVIFRHTWPTALIATGTLSASAWLFRRRVV